MIRGQGTEDRRQMVVCRSAERAERSRGRAASITQSSVLSPQSSEHGFSLVSAIFLLVVIAALGTFAVTLSTTQQQGTAMDVMGARAYQAARAGIEWGAFQVLQNTAGAFATGCQPGPTTQPVTPLPNTLAGFNVNVGCTSIPYTEAGATVTIYQLTSTASAVVTTGNVERQLSVAIAQQ